MLQLNLRGELEKLGNQINPPIVQPPIVKPAVVNAPVVYPARSELPSDERVRETTQARSVRLRDIVSDRTITSVADLDAALADIRARAMAVLGDTGEAAGG
jgi:hypothetical protein